MKLTVVIPCVLAVAAGVGQANVAIAQGPDSMLGLGSASVTFGPYVRGEFGAARMSPSGGYWLPPGFPVDPRVDFDLSGHSTGFGGIGIGYDWMNGFRADIGVLATGSISVTGPHTTPGAHADITAGSVSTTAAMANVFYAPLEQQGVNSRVQPFLTAGIGLASNDMGAWTRTNTATTPVVRTFSGATHTDVAFSLGFGVAYQMTAPGTRPVILEFAYHYYDFGSAEGGSVADKGASTPVQPLTFRNRSSVVSLSVRIPLKQF